MRSDIIQSKQAEEDTMPEGSTTPDLVELVRGTVEALNRRDLDGVMSLFDPDAVWEVGGAGHDLGGSRRDPWLS